jgi:pterin-4a-carbinolamine dehydratase
MKQLTHLHESFIEKANRPMGFGSLPVKQVAASLPIVPISKWTKSAGSLTKDFTFQTSEARSNFLRALLDYEDDCGHHADLRITEDVVVVILKTKGVDSVTELDAEYAKEVDLLFKEVIYLSK